MKCHGCGNRKPETVDQIRINLRYPENAEAIYKKIKWCDCPEESVEQAGVISFYKCPKCGAKMSFSKGHCWWWQCGYVDPEYEKKTQGGE